MNHFGKCPYCGLYHDLSSLCPSIEEIEYYENGSVKRVKMKSPNYPSDNRVTIEIKPNPNSNARIFNF